jgi:MarR family transcriptional regulator, organic hydroperoxide resistance regulator
MQYNARQRTPVNAIAINIFVINYFSKRFLMDARMPDSVPLDLHLCYSLYSTSIAINRLYKPMLDALEITYPQYLVLCTLWERDGGTISTIADRLALESSTITPLVKRLEQAGLVLRRRSAQDERVVEVFLTPKGREMQARATCLTDTLLRRSRLSVDEILSLNQRIQDLRAALTDLE